MKCSHCQHEWTSPPAVCPNCQASGDVPLFSAPPEVEDDSSPRVSETSSFDLLAFSPPEAPELEPPALKGWSWGALLLPVFWTGGMGLWKWCALMLLVILVGLLPGMSLCAGLALLAMSLFLGYQGRALAWSSPGRRWTNAPQFDRAQIGWRNWGIALWLIACVGGAVTLCLQPGHGHAKAGAPIDHTVIARINGKAITRGDLDTAFTMTMKQTADDPQSAITLNSAIQDRKSVVDQLIMQVLTEQTAAKLHCTPASLTWHWTLQSIAGEMADDQLAQMRDSATLQANADLKAPKRGEKQQSADEYLQKNIKQALSGSQFSHFADQDAPDTPEAYKSAFVNFLTTSQEDYGNLEPFNTMARTRLIGEAVAKALHVSPLSADYVKKLNTQEVQASIIFIAAKDDSTGALHDAQNTASGLRAQVIKNQAVFPDLAKAHSDDLMTKMAGGAIGIGPNGRGSGWLQADGRGANITVEYLAFSTGAGHVSPLMVMQQQGMFGMSPKIGYAFVLVRAIHERTDLAPEFNWQKAEARALPHEKMRYEDAFGQTCVAVQRLSATIERLTPEMNYYQLQPSDDAKQAEALLRTLAFDTTLPPVVRAAFKFQLARQTQDPSLFDGEIFSYAGADATRMFFEIAKLYASRQKFTDALSNLKSAADNCETQAQGKGAGADDNAIHEAIKTEYANLLASPSATEAVKKEAADGVKRMDDWLTQNPKPAPAAPKRGQGPL